jgi:hypothetical protein
VVDGTVAFVSHLAVCFFPNLDPWIPSCEAIGRDPCSHVPQIIPWP